MINLVIGQRFAAPTHSILVLTRSEFFWIACIWGVNYSNSTMAFLIGSDPFQTTWCTYILSEVKVEVGGLVTIIWPKLGSDKHAQWSALSVFHISGTSLSTDKTLTTSLQLMLSLLEKPQGLNPEPKRTIQERFREIHPGIPSEGEIPRNFT